MSERPIFLKLGGSLITDKTQRATPRPEVITRLADEIRQALDARPDLPLLLGHGSGSFGHWEGRRYGTRAGVVTPSDWVGYAKVSAVAARLNRLVTDALLAAGVPVLSLQPSASTRCHDGTITHLATGPIRRALESGLLPLVYGDVALDEVRGGTIISTEEIFGHLAGEFNPARILLVGEAEGVYGGDGEVVPRISPDNVARVEESLAGSQGVDVTGGMLSKVAHMLDLVQAQPGIKVHVFSGVEPGLLARVLLEPELPVGTRILGGA